MELRSVAAAPLVALAFTASCPYADDAPAKPRGALAPSPPPAPVVSIAVAAAPRSAQVADTAEPAPSLGASVPPDLVDDGSDDADIDAAVEPAAPEPRPAPPRLASIAHETWIFAQPKWTSRRLGYLRAGAIVPRSAQPAGFGGCADGWYRIEPRGYVCVGQTATLDLEHPIVAAAARRPTFDGLPYPYIMVKMPPPPLYVRLPTAAEQLEAEPGLASFARAAARAARDPAAVAPAPPDAAPTLVSARSILPALSGPPRAPDKTVLRTARTRSGFALLASIDHEGRRFGLTADFELVPLDRARAIRPSAFAGIALDDATTLPVAFVRAHHAVRWVTAAAGAGGAPLAWREAVPLGEGRRTVGGITYLEAKGGGFVRADDVVRVDPYETEPSWARTGRKWIDVSIGKQALVAYEGTKPVYVTLVSTGADGLGDPETTRSTILGTFLIHTKHVSVTMDGDEDDEDPFDFRDVPFVQYFTEGFALHAAYWHDDFGTPRSHGCVNLSPRDAAWLFQWTTPEVPDGWHGALSLKRGTLVHTHP